MKDQSTLNIRNRILIALLIFSITGLAIILANSFFTRPFADDFCVVNSVNSQSFLEYIINDYMGFMGKISYIVLTGITAKMGLWAYQIMPIFFILSFYFIVNWASFPCFKYYYSESPILGAASFSSLFILLLFNSLPDLFESVFWNAGSVNYLAPIILFTLLAGFFIRLIVNSQRSQSWFIFPIILITFFAGMFSEIYSMLQITIYFILIVGLYRIPSKSTKKFVKLFAFAGLLIAIISFLIVYFAPGNAGRQAASHQKTPTALLQMPLLSIKHILVVFYEFIVLGSKVWIIPMFLIPFGFGALSQQNLEVNHQKPVTLKSLINQGWVRFILLIGILVLFLTFIAVLPTTYIQGTYPPRRAMIVLFYFILLGIMIIMYTLGKNITFVSKLFHIIFQNHKKRHFLLTFILIISILVFKFGTLQNLSWLNTQRHSAQAWDQRHQILIDLSHKGVTSVTYPGLDLNPKYWVNRCLATYYGFETISGSSSFTE